MINDTDARASAGRNFIQTFPDFADLLRTDIRIIQGFPQKTAGELAPLQLKTAFSQADIASDFIRDTVQSAQKFIDRLLIVTALHVGNTEIKMKQRSILPGVLQSYILNNI